MPRIRRVSEPRRGMRARSAGSDDAVGTPLSFGARLGDVELRMLPWVTGTRRFAS